MTRTHELTERELTVVAAWWHTGTVVEAANLLHLKEQTAKNILHQARLRSGAPTTLALARMYSKDLPSLAIVRRKARVA